MNDDLDEIGNLPSDKQFFLAMKRLNTPKRNIIWGSKDKNGKILTSKDGILERWASFYQDLYDDQNSHNEINIAAIKKLRTGKSPGIDSIHSLTVSTLKFRWGDFN